MKQFVLIVLLSLFSGFIQGQDKTREEVLQMIAEDTCECIEKDKSLFDKSKTMNQKQMGLGFCLLKSFNARKSESKAFEDKGINDFEELGEEVGLLMVTTCPETFISLFSEEQLENMMNEELNVDVPPPPPPPAPKNDSDLNIEAELISINNEAVWYIEVNDSYGKSHTFIVSEQFEGFDLLKKSNLNVTFTIFFKEVDYFDLSERRYVKKKVIKYIEKI